MPNFAALHLLRYTVFNLAIFKTYDKSKISDNDFVLPTAFNNRPRAFEFMISTDPDVRVISTKNAKPIALYKLGLDDSSINLFVVDGYWLKKSEYPGTFTEIYRYDDSTRAFRPPKNI